MRVLHPSSLISLKAKSQADQNEIDRRAKEAVSLAKKQKALETTPMRRAIQAQERKKTHTPTRPSTSKPALPPSPIPAPANYRVPKRKQPGTPPMSRKDPQTPPGPFIDSPLLLPTAKRRTDSWPISPSQKVHVGSLERPNALLIYDLTCPRTTTIRPTARDERIGRMTSGRTPRSSTQRSRNSVRPARVTRQRVHH